MNIYRRDSENLEIEEQPIAGQLNSSVSFTSNTMEVEESQESTINPNMSIVGYRTVNNRLC